MTDGQLSRPNTKKGRLQRVALALLREHEGRGELPTSVRFLFYEAEQMGHVTKVRTGARRADQDFGDAVTALRDRGIVPWSWIVDETRTVHEWTCAPTVADFTREAVHAARIDPWIDVRPLIITEARTTAGVFSRTFGQQYLVPVAATNGQAGGFLVTDVVPLVRERPTLVLYVGDLDLAGNGIEQNTRRVLEH